jgi:hypothetical protein
MISQEVEVIPALDADAADILNCLGLQETGTVQERSQKVARLSFFDQKKRDAAAA